LASCNITEWLPATDYREHALMNATLAYVAWASLVMLLGCAASTAAELTPPVLAPPVFATAPPKSVKNWIWYQIVGLRNHPFPIVYLSTKRFDTRLPEVLIVVARPRFSIVSKYTRSRIARSDCANGRVEPGAVGNVEIAVHEGGRTLRCVMPQASACDFLAGVEMLSGMDWTADELKPIVDLAVNVGACHYRQDTNGQWHHDPT
jgi:hypothetical protein